VRYLVGAKGADTKAKRDLNSALDRISEQIPTDFQPKAVWEGDSESKIHFVTGWRRASVIYLEE
jgi:putative component of toxin-antitoxin plasmid stabilization module